MSNHFGDTSIWDFTEVNQEPDSDRSQIDPLPKVIDVGKTLPQLQVPDPNYVLSQVSEASGFNSNHPIFVLRVFPISAIGKFYAPFLCYISFRFQRCSELNQRWSEIFRIPTALKQTWIYSEVELISAASLRRQPRIVRAKMASGCRSSLWFLLRHSFMNKVSTELFWTKNWTWDFQIFISDLTEGKEAALLVKHVSCK